MTLKTHLLAVARAYAAGRGLSLSRVSTLVRNDGKFFDRIAGGADCTTGVYETSLAWFRANWPEGAPWPDDESADTAEPAGISAPVSPAALDDAAADEAPSGSAAVAPADAEAAIGAI